jgi:hypothetical protein
MYIVKNCPKYIEGRPIYTWNPSANLVELSLKTSWFVKLACGKHRRNAIIGMIAVKLDMVDYFG